MRKRIPTRLVLPTALGACASCIDPRVRVRVQVQVRVQVEPSCRLLTHSTYPAIILTEIPTTRTMAFLLSLFQPVPQPHPGETQALTFSSIYFSGAFTCLDLTRHVPHYPTLVLPIEDTPFACPEEGWGRSQSLALWPFTVNLGPPKESSHLKCTSSAHALECGVSGCVGVWWVV